MELIDVTNKTFLRSVVDILFTSAARSSTPTENAITNLCKDTARKLIQTSVPSFSNPMVIPSITLWNDKAATTKNVRIADLVCNPDSVPSPLNILDTLLSLLGILESPDMLSNIYDCLLWDDRRPDIRLSGTLRS